MRTRRYLARGCAIGLAAMASAAAAQDGSTDSANDAPAVIVQTVKDQVVTRSTQFVGRIQAIQQTDLRARVEGFLEAVDFHDGAMVTSGEQLYQIETGPYEAALASAKAALASGNAAKAGAQAKLKDADLTLERQKTLLKSNTVSQAAVDKAQSVRDQAYAELQNAEAQIASANAQIQTAELNLGYTKVTSPIDGRIGKTNYTKGNLVSPSSGTLATVVQMDPMRVVFSISDRDYVQVIETANHPGSAGGSTAGDDASDGGSASTAGTSNDTTANTGASSGGAADAGGGTATASGSDAGAPDAGASGTDGSGASGSTADATATTSSDANAPDADASDTGGSDTGGSGASASSAAPSEADTAGARNPSGLGAPNVDIRKDFVPTLILPNGKTYPNKGEISFIDNEVDPNTGTIAVYADFPNKEFVLVPGQFVTVSVAIGQPRREPVIPAGAVLQDKDGPYVLKVDQDDRAQIQRIQTAEKMQTGWAVASGLSEGDTIIVDGIQKVKPGQVVKPQQAKPAS